MNRQLIGTGSGLGQEDGGGLRPCCPSCVHCLLPTCPTSCPLPPLLPSHLPAFAHLPFCHLPSSLHATSMYALSAFLYASTSSPSLSPGFLLYFSSLTLFSSPMGTPPFEKATSAFCFLCAALLSLCHHKHAMCTITAPCFPTGIYPLTPILLPYHPTTPYTITKRKKKRKKSVCGLPFCLSPAPMLYPSTHCTLPSS